MSTDLQAIAKRAIKKSTGQYPSLEVLELFPLDLKQQKNSLEEGTLKIYFPDFGVDLRGIYYKIRPSKKVAIIMPYKTFPIYGEPSKEGKKAKLRSVDIFSFRSEEVWENVREEIKRQTLELFEKNQSEPSIPKTP